MAQITFTVPDAVALRILSATAYLNGYTDTVLNPQGQSIPNPVTKSAFVKSVIISMLKDNLRAYESASTITTATQSLHTEVESMSIT